MNDKRHSSGISIIETIFYVAVLVVVIVVLVNLGVIMTRSFSDLSASRSIKNTAVVSIGRFLFESRHAESVDTAVSVFGTDPGVLVLTTPATTTEFYVEDDTLKIRQNGFEQGALTPPGVVVNKAIFWHTQTGTSEGVRFELSLSAEGANEVILEEFFASAILRNSYAGE